MEQAKDPATPAPLDRLAIRIEQYQYYGERTASAGICPLLVRAWAGTLCRGQHKGALQKLPLDFELYDRAKLDLLKNTFTVGKERAYDQVKNFALNLKQTEIGCDQRSRFCKAAVQVHPGLVAVWTVWTSEDNKVTASDMAARQGAAIVQFVTRAIGTTEDVSYASEN